MSHSLNYNINRELQTLILNTANNNPAPILGTVAGISDDGRYIDVNLDRGGTLPSIKLFSGIPIKGKEVLLVFVDGDINKPRAFIEDYEVKTPTYNLLENGNFAKYTNNAFSKWTGGTLSTTSYYGDNGCELRAGQTLTSDFVDISAIIDDEAFTVSFIWVKEGFTLQVYNQNDELITALPSVLGTAQKTSYVDDWSFQRYNYNLEGVTHVKVKFTNNSDSSSFVDGVRIWNPDDYQEWFPHTNDD